MEKNKEIPEADRKFWKPEVIEKQIMLMVDEIRRQLLGLIEEQLDKELSNDSERSED